jgi:hypothetical protein
MLHFELALIKCDLLFHSCGELKFLDVVILIRCIQHDRHIIGVLLLVDAHINTDEALLTQGINAKF